MCAEAGLHIDIPEYSLLYGAHRAGNNALFTCGPRQVTTLIVLSHSAKSHILLNDILLRVAEATPSNVGRGWHSTLMLIAMHSLLTSLMCAEAGAHPHLQDIF